jgi:CheY-like chemotaxis protein
MPAGKVLIVDDEPHVRRIAALCLGSVGRWGVVLASSGAEALDVAAREGPDLIMLDVMMPGLDGATTLAALRAQAATAAIPIIFMTAKTRDAELDRYLGMDVLGVVKKPFDPLLLADHVAQILAGERRVA